MSFIVKRKGLFGTIYIATKHYDLYQATTNKQEDAYVFETYAEAKKNAKKIRGEVIKISENNQETLEEIE